MSKAKIILQELFDFVKVKLINSFVGRQILKRKTESQTDSLYKAVGQLIFSDSKKPLHNMEVELWDKDIGTPDEYLGKGVTDKNGYFEIYYDPQKANFKDAPDLELRILETRSSFNANNEIVFSSRLAYIIKGEDNVTKREYDFGTCTVPYWIYNPSTPFPRVMFTDLDGTPDEYAIGRKLKGYEVADIYQPVKTKHIIENTLNPKKPFIKDIQSDYPANLTIATEEKTPGYTRGDDFFGLRVLNGMNPCLFKINKNNPHQYKVIFNWDAYEKNDTHDLHNVDATFEVKDGKLLPIDITIQTRYPDFTSAFSPLKEPVTYTPKDGDKWLQAKRIFRTNYLFCAELVEHYIKSHLQMEQYTIAVFRNLRKNPVRLLLLPHLKSLININRRADTILVTESGYVTNAGFLTSKSVEQVCRDRMQKLDWMAWKPRKPLTDSHTYAKVANLYWDVLTEYVDVFFKKHHDAILQEWFEIHRLSDDLVEHSVAYEHALEKESQADSDSYEWYDFNEVDKADIPRHQINGTLKAIRPITSSDEPSDNDIDNLKQFCRYVIFHTTLWHTWVNDSQTDDGGEVAYSSLGLRNGSFGTEDDAAIAPTPAEAAQLLFLVHTLSEIKYGYILKNEDGDIPQELRTILLRSQRDFAELGFDVNNIRSLINI